MVAETKLDGANPLAILKTVSRQSPFFMNQLKLIDEVNSVKMEHAFAILSRASYAIRKQFLEVCERIVVVDKKATIEEVELLRAIAIGIGVPAAPIFPDSAPMV